MSTVTIYNNLLVQFEKLFKHNRQGSYKTKERYGDAFKRFLRFLATEYRLERLANISSKHLYAYTEYMTAKGLSLATIKTELAAIRFFHDQIPEARNRLHDNELLALERRSFGGVDRTWSAQEFNRFTLQAMALGREDYAACFCLARYAGLRIHECFRMDTATAAKAVHTNLLTIKGKGGLVRTIPINDSIHIELQKLLAVTPCGQKLFVAPAEKTHLAIHRLEAFIACYHRTLQDEASNRPMTFHGLRHSYAAEQYQIRVADGMSPLQARRQVAHLLGHGRDDVAKIYLASVENN